MFWMGIYPQTFLRKMDASVSNLVNRIHQREKVFIRSQKADQTLSPPASSLLPSKTDEPGKDRDRVR